jgi:hypothetical protein
MEMYGMYAIFLYHPRHNSLTFYAKSKNKYALLDDASNRFDETVWFAIYKFDSHTFLCGSKIKATKWMLDTTKAQSNATEYIKTYTPMETAYEIQDEHGWFFKTY